MRLILIQMIVGGHEHYWLVTHQSSCYLTRLSLILLSLLLENPGEQKTMLH